MLKLEEIQAGALVEGLAPGRLVTVIATTWHGDHYVEVFSRTPTRGWTGRSCPASTRSASARPLPRTPGRSMVTGGSSNWPRRPAASATRAPSSKRSPAPGRNGEGGHHHRGDQRPLRRLRHEHPTHSEGRRHPTRLRLPRIRTLPQSSVPVANRASLSESLASLHAHHCRGHHVVVMAVQITIRGCPRVSRDEFGCPSRAQVPFHAGLPTRRT